jgi:hypothetical protein
MLSKLAQQTAFLASKRANAAALSRYGMTLVKGFSSQPNTESYNNSSHITEKVPKEDYYDGHLLVDHLEYIDDMIGKVMELNESLTELKQTKEDAVLAARTTGVRWIDSADIDRLFEKTKTTKAELAAQHEQLIVMMADAKKYYAVDGPDGDSDGHVKEELEEVNHIIADTAAMDRDTARQLAEMQKTYAVDSPEGDPDALVNEEIQVINSIVADTAAMDHDTARQLAEMQKTYAVDSPEGDPDALVNEEIQVIHSIVADVAASEDAAKIKYRHKMEGAVRNDRVKDPEHDW